MNKVPYKNIRIDTLEDHKVLMGDNLVGVGFVKEADEVPSETHKYKIQVKMPTTISVDIGC